MESPFFKNMNQTTNPIVQLFCAVGEGDFLKVKSLVEGEEKKLVQHFYDEDLLTNPVKKSLSLCKTCGRAYIDKLKLVLENGANSVARMTILCKGCFKDDTEIVIFIIKNDAYDNAQNISHKNLAWKHFEIVKHQINNGAGIFAVHVRALCIACFRGSLEMVKYLYERGGVNIHLELDLLLKISSIHGYVDIVNFLIDKGAKSNNETIVLCVRHDKLEVLKILIANGADIHADNENALSWATFNRNYKCVKYLLQMGANPRANSDKIFEKALVCNFADIVNLFLKTKLFDLNEDKMIRIFRTYSDDPNIAIVFLDNGASPNFLNPKNLPQIRRLQKEREQKKVEAIVKIQKWWLKKCYNLNDKIGKRVAEKNYNKLLELYDNK